MKTSNYQRAKEFLKGVSLAAKQQFKGDRAAIRTIINDSCYQAEQDYNLTEYQTTLLQNYACKLHPKK